MYNCNGTSINGIINIEMSICVKTFYSKKYVSSFYLS